MHPPWITLSFLFLLLVVVMETLGDKRANFEDENSTVSRIQREINERERRLIPYMTYYVTQSLTNSNTGERQNVFLPVTPPRENIFRFDGTPKIAAGNLPNENLLHFTQILSKPVGRIQNPVLLTSPKIQAGHQEVQFKSKPDIAGILPQVYRIDGEPVQPRIPTQVQTQQIQSESQPLQVIRINQVPVEQKLSGPPLIKIIPIITKTTSPQSIIPQPQYGYAKLQTLLSNAYESNSHNIYQEPIGRIEGNSFQRNKAYATHVPQENTPHGVGQPLEPEKNKYGSPKIFVGSTTPSPYVTDIKLNVNDVKTAKVLGNVHSVQATQLGQNNPTPTGRPRGPIVTPASDFSSNKFTAINPGQRQIYYNKDENFDTEGRVILTQTSPPVQDSLHIPRLRVPQEENIRFVATVTPVPLTNDLGNLTPLTAKYDEDQKKVKPVNVYDKASLDNILSLLKETSNLPQNLTPENIDSGIRTLALILERLQQQKNYQQIYKSPPSSSSGLPESDSKTAHRSDTKVHSFPQRSGTSTPGRPGIDYPTYSSIPQTKFDCSTQRYKGFFGDPDTKCQVWHYCDLNGGQASFLCPNGTIFSQVALTCDWWFNVKCASTSQLYVLNERLYKYILPFSPSFPEDYSGPIVDTYLAAKFREMESKSKSKAQKATTSTSTTSTEKPEGTSDLSSEDQTETVPEYRTTDREE